MQLKIPFGSSWELLRAALPEWWEYSIPAPRAGVSVCSRKTRAGTAGTRLPCLLGPTDKEMASPSPGLASSGRRGPTSSIPAPGGVPHQPRALAVLGKDNLHCGSISNHFPFGEHLAGWIVQLPPGKGAEPFPVTSRC